MAWIDAFSQIGNPPQEGYDMAGFSGFQPGASGMPPVFGSMPPDIGPVPNPVVEGDKNKYGDLSQHERALQEQFLKAKHKFEMAVFDLKNPPPPTISKNQAWGTLAGTALFGALDKTHQAGAQFGQAALAGIQQQQQQQAQQQQAEYQRRQQMAMMQAQQQGEWANLAGQNANRYDSMQMRMEQASAQEDAKKMQAVGTAFNSAKTPGDLVVRLKALRERGVLPGLTDDEIQNWVSDKRAEYDAAQKDKRTNALTDLMLRYPGMVNKVGEINGSLSADQVSQLQDMFEMLQRREGVESPISLTIPVGKTMKGAESEVKIKKIESSADLDKATAAFRRAEARTKGPESAAKINKWQAEAKAALIKAQKYMGGGSGGSKGPTEAQKAVQSRFDQGRFDKLRDAWEKASDAAAKYGSFNDPADAPTTAAAKSLAAYWSDKRDRLANELRMMAPPPSSNGNVDAIKNRLGIKY